MKSNTSLLAHPTRDRRQHGWFVPAIVKHSIVVSVKAQWSSVFAFRRGEKRFVISVLVIKRTERGVRGLKKKIEAALWQPDIEIRDLPKNVAHRDVESAALFEGKTAKIFEKICFKLPVVLISLLQKIFAAEAKHIARLARDVLEEFSEPMSVTLLFACVVTFDAVQCHTAGTQHPLHFS